MLTPVGRAILDELAPMFDEARRTGKWFFLPYQSLWFSPDELAAEHAKCSMIFSAVNWRLRDPGELIAGAEADFEKACKALDSARQRVAAQGGKL